MLSVGAESAPAKGEHSRELYGRWDLTFLSLSGLQYSAAVEPPPLLFLFSLVALQGREIPMLSARILAVLDTVTLFFELSCHDSQELLDLVTPCSS